MFKDVIYVKISIERSSGIPVYKQIAMQIKEKILTQELAAGLRLPPERRLAEEIGVNRNTVIKAYDLLIAEGFAVVSREKPKGYFVIETPDKLDGFGLRLFPFEKVFRYEVHKEEKRFNEIYWESETKNAISFAGMIMDRTIDPVKDMDHVTKRILKVVQMHI